MSSFWSVIILYKGYDLTGFNHRKERYSLVDCSAPSVYPLYGLGFRV